MTIDKRINFRGGGAYQQGSGAPGSAESSSKNTSPGTGGSSGNIGGGGGGQDSDYRRYSPPVAPTYTSSNIDQKPVTGDDYRRSENEFINKFNQDQASRFEPTFFNRNYSPITLDQFGSSNQPPEYGNFITTGIMSLINPLLGKVYGAYDFLKDQSGGLKNGLMDLNNQIQNTNFARSTSLPDYLNMRSYGGYDEREMAAKINMDEARLIQADIDSGVYDGMGVKPVQTVESNSSGIKSPLLPGAEGATGLTIAELQALINNSTNNLGST